MNEKNNNKKKEKHTILVDSSYELIQSMRKKSIRTTLNNKICIFWDN
jgi:hypothetical protein